jgi:hypothetical protein
MRPAMTGQQADALAAFIVTLRPGQRRWTKAAVYDALSSAGVKFSADAEMLARAAIRAALTASIASPEVIAMPGAHWESVNHSPAHEPVRATRCRTCHGLHMPDAPHESRPVVPSQLIATARAIAANAKRPVDRTAKPEPITDTPLPEEDE